MGNTSRFFKALFCLNSTSTSTSTHPPLDLASDKQTKRCWTFFYSTQTNKHKPHNYHILSVTSPRHPRYTDQTGEASTNHDIAVVSSDYGLSGEWAAVKIQSYCRGYLARKELRALRSLVKFQALVRGHIQRKQTADELRRLQALVRAQARICVRRLKMT